MLSRGALGLASPRLRRGLALSWSALFVLSLLLQYASFALAPAALAVHDDGLFELDGNAVSSGAVPGDDWDKVKAGTSAAGSTAFVHDLVNDQADDTFKGNTGDDMVISDWRWVTAKASQAKNDIADVFAAAYTNADNHTIAYFGLDKWEADGDNFVGFWFFKGKVAPAGDGSTASGDPFSGSHQVGDILVLADYTNGGGVATFNVYKWVGSGGNVGPAHTLQTVASGVPCTGGSSSDDACAVTNTDTETAPWSFDGRDGDPGEFPAGTFFEGGIDLTALGLDAGCFTSFLGETRSSQEVSATLSDFAGGTFSFCVPPDIATQVQQDGQSLGSVGTISLGDSVTDKATLTGAKGTVAGTVDFHVCFNASQTPNCDSGGTKAGATKTLSGGIATSDSFTPSAVGYYCFRVDYHPAEGSKYLEASHTNQTTECFQVLPANVTIDKTADDGTVSAGSQIGFTLSWGNSGAGKATGVVVTDTLPTDPGLSWSIAGSTGTGSTCAIAAGVLTCNVGSINGNTAVSGTVHIVSPTTAASCGTVDNTGHIGSTNDGQANASDSVDVLCADVAIAKAANPKGPVSAGDPIGFDVTVTNKGDGTATGVSMTDPLPAGVDWTLGAVSGDTTGVNCAISGAVGGETLTCTDGSMAAGDSFTVHVSGPTDPTDCGTVNNTATVTSTNDGGGQASASVDVRCPDIEVVKDAPNDTIPAGQDLVFTITVRNIGTGIARDVVLHDALPAGFDWEADNAACQIAGSQLTCTIGDMDPQDTFTVTLTAPTSADPDTGNIDCSEGGTIRIPNVASADASNEGQDVLGNNSDDAVIDVLCSALLIEKDVTGNTGGTFNDPGSPLNGLKQAKIGDTLTYHLTYAGSGPLTNAVITDPVPDGLEYIVGSASSDANFTFDSYDAATRTLTWTAATLPNPVSGEVTFQVTVLAEAAEIGIVLNVATIDSDQTPPDDGDVPVGVLPPPEELTPPPTDVFTPATGTSNPGFALMLILIGVAVVTIGIGFVTPVPAAARKPERRR